MEIQTLSFSNGNQAKLGRVSDDSEFPALLDALNLNGSRPVIALVGGAGGIDAHDRRACYEAVRAVVHTANRVGAAIVDGGTAAGVMDFAGRVRARNGFTIPLIGVAVECTVDEPDGSIQEGCLQPDHSHFIFTPGENWGDEALWLAQTAGALANGAPSLTVLVNGGDIARRRDLPASLKEKRPILVVKGTGRLADEIAARDPNVPMLYVTAIKDIYNSIYDLLT